MFNECDDANGYNSNSNHNHDDNNNNDNNNYYYNGNNDSNKYDADNKNKNSNNGIYIVEVVNNSLVLYNTLHLMFSFLVSSNNT